MTRTIRIGSRKSRLALVQSEHVGSLLAADPEVRYEIVRVDTAGDKQRDVPLPEVGGKGLFTAELEEMLRAGSVDIAVHSLKDLPGELGAGLVVGAVGAREDPRDVLVARGGGTLAELPAGARVGTGSVRRAAQILSLRPDVAIASIRGNVPTRLEKLDRGEYDAVVLAAAGLHRLGLVKRATEFFDTAAVVPAAGQGALGIECRADDADTLRVLRARVNETAAETCCRAERAVAARLEGGCNAPLGVHATLGADGRMTIVALATDVSGRRLVRVVRTASAAEWAELAKSVAADMIEKGANELLDAARRGG